MKHQAEAEETVVCNWECYLYETRADGEETIERPAYNTV